VREGTIWRVLFAVAALVAVAALGPCAWAAEPVEAGPGAAAPGELTRVYAQILRDPTNSALNLYYAKLAEETGKLRWALSAYERVLVNDPGNAEALAGLQRVRRRLQPDTTQFVAELGAIGETNPRYLPSGARAEVQGLATLAMRDERTLADVRWRTTAAAYGLVHSNERDLDYGYFGAATGPVLDFIPGVLFHPALGGAATYFDGRFFYSEAAAMATFEDNWQGLYRAVRFRGAFREYDSFWPSRRGFYADAVGKFSFRLTAQDLLIVSPWVRWSDINGSVVTTPLLIDVEPGAYIEGGGKFELYHGVFEWLLLGANVTLYERFYRSDIVGSLTERRHDFVVIPGAAVVFPNLLGFHRDLRLEYKFQRDFSNDPTIRFNDHIVAATVAARF
jgi:hypothetical protein